MVQVLPGHTAAHSTDAHVHAQLQQLARSEYKVHLISDALVAPWCKVLDQPERAIGDGCEGVRALVQL